MTERAASNSDVQCQPEFSDHLCYKTLRDLQANGLPITTSLEYSRLLRILWALGSGEGSTGDAQAESPLADVGHLFAWEKPRPEKPIPSEPSIHRIQMLAPGR
jgi:hypothetical protein